MKTTFFIILVILGISCSSKPWSNDDVDEFIAGCISEGGSKEYCDCYLENMMQKYPIADDSDNIDYETKIDLSKNCIENEN